MKDLILTGTDHTPEVNFSCDGNLKISGVSIPENVNKFYDQLLTWIDQFEKSSPKSLTLTIDFEYINSSTLNFLLFKLFSKIISLAKNNTALKVIWVYPKDDDDIEDMGKNMEEVLQVQTEVNNIQEEIESAAGRVEFLSHQSSYSTINLTFFQPLQGYKPTDITPSFLTRVSTAFKIGTSWIADLFVGLIAIWPLLLIIIGIYFGWKKLRPVKTPRQIL